MNKFYTATAIAYASAKPHIGNVYEIILADSIARYKRKKNNDTFFLTGTDEHGQKIEQIALSKEITPKQLVDDVSTTIKGLFKDANISNDYFVRTTDEQHKLQVQKIYQKLFDQGDIYKGHYEGMYCEPCESFFTESQTEKGLCPDCGRELKPAQEEAYFFKLSKYQDRLLNHINENDDFIIPQIRKNEMLKNFLKDELPDLCVSRSTFKWGIELPFDKDHVSYVWLDALSNYITALGYDVDGNHSETFKKYWPCDLHVVGKDIMRFHTIYWPILLMALDIELPKQILGHPWILIGESKISKSSGNMVYTDDLSKDFGIDAVRYYVLHETPFDKDGTFTHELFIERYNAELANTLGNLVSRTIAMVVKYFDGEVSQTFNYEQADLDLINQSKKAISDYMNYMNKFNVSEAIEAIMEFNRKSNKYIDITEPWVLGKDESQKERLNQVLYNLLESIRIISILLEPIMPETSAKILGQINVEDNSFESLKEFGQLVPSKLAKVKPLFARIDVKQGD